MAGERKDPSTRMRLAPLIAPARDDVGRMRLVALVAPARDDGFLGSECEGQWTCSRARAMIGRSCGHRPYEVGLHRHGTPGFGITADCMMVDVEPGSRDDGHRVHHAAIGFNTHPEVTSSTL